MNPKMLKLPQDKDYEKFIKKMPCLICKVDGVDMHHLWHNRSLSYACVPLCRGHHREFHDVEWEEFERRHNISLLEWSFMLLSVYTYTRNQCVFESAKDEMKFYQEWGLSKK